MKFSQMLMYPPLITQIFFLIASMRWMCIRLSETAYKIDPLYFIFMEDHLLPEINQQLTVLIFVNIFQKEDMSLHQSTIDYPTY